MSYEYFFLIHHTKLEWDSKIFQPNIQNGLGL